MQQTIDGSTANKWMYLKNSIYGVGGSKVIVEANSKGFRTESFTSRAKLYLAKLTQTFSTTLILHYFDPEYHIWFETNAQNFAIGKI